MRNPLQALVSIMVAIAATLPLTGCDGTDRESLSADAPAPGSGTPACCLVTPTAGGVQEGVGRIVVRYPGDGTATPTRVDVFAARDTATSIGGGWGDQSIEVPPGEYAVVIGGKRVDGVAVEAGSDTRVRVGLIHVFAGDATRVDFLDPTNDQVLATGHGEQRYGFPVGPVAAMVAGQTDLVLVEDDQVVEF